MKTDVQAVTFLAICESSRKRGEDSRKRKREGGKREKETRDCGAVLCGQIKFKRMTRTLVSRAEQWPFEHTPLEDLSRRLLTLRCTVETAQWRIVPSSSPSLPPRRRSSTFSTVRKYRGIEIGGRQLLLPRNLTRS